MLSKLVNRISRFKIARWGKTPEKSLKAQDAVNLTKNERNCSITYNFNHHAYKCHAFTVKKAFRKFRVVERDKKYFENYLNHYKGKVRLNVPAKMLE